MSIPAQQRAWISVRRGTPSTSGNIKLSEDWPVDKNLRPGEVLVKVQAAALNPVGYKLQKLLPNFFAGRPYVLEHDLSGTVVDANDSERFTSGDQVFGWVPAERTLKSKQGALAQYVSVPSTNITRRPANLSPIEAAGITLTALTALQGLEQSKLEEGQSIFVYGAGTTVGHWVVQLAKLKGARVVVAASGKRRDTLIALGADEFIDYTQSGPMHTYFAKHPPAAPYNVIFDAYGLFDPSIFTHSKGYLAPNGIFMSVGPQPHAFNLKVLGQGLRLASAMYLPSFLTGIKAQYKLPLVKENVNHMDLLSKYLEEGKLVPLVDSVFNFEDVVQAYERIMTGKATGKVTVIVDPSVAPPQA